MAIKPLKSIKFPGLPDTYTINAAGLSSSAKAALLACFRNVAWKNGSGEEYYNALVLALNEAGSNHITATLTLGNHDVYNTDNIESLRHFLHVEELDSGGTSAVITDYTLSGDISTTGTKTITVTYNEMTTTFSVNVISNPTGIIYEWDFTRGFTDLRQYKTASAIAFGGNSPTIDANGVHFNNEGQRLELLPANASAEISYFANKTIQVDVGSYAPKSENDSYHTRFIMFRRDEGSGSTNVWDTGLVYRKANTTSATVGWSIYAGNNGWGSQIQNMNRDAISGHTVCLYLDANLKPKIYLDSTLKSNQSLTFPTNDTIKGLSIGSTTPARTGGTVYDATITKIRIYSGEVSA